MHFTPAQKQYLEDRICNALTPARLRAERLKRSVDPSVADAAEKIVDGIDLAVFYVRDLKTDGAVSGPGPETPRLDRKLP